MKLATLKDGTRDGRLAVVSRDLTRFTDASFLARTLQAALDDWRRVSPHLAALAESLEVGSVPASRFHEHDALSPLPRACRGGAAVVAPRDPIRVADDGWGVECAVEAAVVVDDLAMGSGADAAREAIRLVVLVGDVTLRALPEAAGSFQSRPFSSFSPVAVTPDELGDAWGGGAARLPLAVDLNGRPSGRPDADAALDFPALVARAARTRPLSAGTIVGSGAEPAVGTATPVLRFGDTVRVEMRDRTGHSVFGAIEQTVESHGR